MGPSVKFVLPIIDAFPNKKNGGNFWCGKKGRNGGGWGGSEGVAFFGRKFSRLSFLNTSLILNQHFRMCWTFSRGEPARTSILAK